ncbi:MAG: hypothetical protein U1D31_01945 [Patescibacteria group bacterium]|nr:hypothetical protein [bacterium]MDZ4240867.1 hypothetical protein [Patescibacteria group bacterium]
MRNEKINSKIIALWNKYFKNDPDVYAPLFYDEFRKGGLLFVGMNPSFSVRGFKTILQNTEYKDMDPSTFFKWSNISANPALIDDCVKVENYAYANYSLYFGRPVEIAKKVGLDWQHIDLFLYKETAQNNFMARITNKEKLNQFALDQIALFEEVLTKIEPCCVVVTNAFGSELLRDHIKNDLLWDEECGFHWFTKSGKKIPMFFSSMLSGQRALDRWSYERLKWHIGQAVKKQLI